MIGVDSVSRLNFHRQFPETTRILKEKLGAYEMYGYNKVRDNTFVNLVPLFLGTLLPYNNGVYIFYAFREQSRFAGFLLQLAIFFSIDTWMWYWHWNSVSPYVFILYIWYFFVPLLTDASCAWNSSQRFSLCFDIYQVNMWKKPAGMKLYLLNLISNSMHGRDSLALVTIHCSLKMLLK